MWKMFNAYTFVMKIQKDTNLNLHVWESNFSLFGTLTNCMKMCVIHKKPTSSFPC